MLPTEITSAELQALSGYAKASLTELEQAGVIKRDAKNVWPIDTVTKLIVHLRERGRRPADDDRSRFEKMRAAREELKLKKELGEVVFTTDFVEACDQLVFCGSEPAGAAAGANWRSRFEAAQAGRG